LIFNLNGIDRVVALGVSGLSDGQVTAALHAPGPLRYAATANLNIAALVFATVGLQPTSEDAMPRLRINRICTIDGCGRKAMAKGLCPAHYYRKKGNKPLDAPVTRQGESSHPLYSTWRMMIQRCHNPNNRQYPNWGGRGIEVCRRWRDSFLWFAQDVGEKPSPEHTLDRYPDKNGNYEPGNCRWATKEEQARNRRNTVVTPELKDQIVEMVLAGQSRSSVAAQLDLDYSLVAAAVRPYLEEKQPRRTKPIEWRGELIRRGKPVKTCSIEGCDREHYGKGYCRRHWFRIVYNPEIGAKLEGRKCRQCEGPIDEFAPAQVLYCSGACRMKYYRRHGCYRPEEVLERRGACGVEGCDSPIHAAGMCSAHYHRYVTYGDPEHVRQPKPMKKCSVEGCENKHASRGYCFHHYFQKRNAGEFGAHMVPRRKIEPSPDS
jgi:hypothetical protein